MLDKPSIPDSTIIAHLSDHYALTIRSLEFLPLGYDSYASVYRVIDYTHTPYFLKLKQGDFNPISASVPHALRSLGVSEVVAPIPTRLDALYTTLDSYAVLLYPFIDGANGMSTPMSDAQWSAFGQIVKRIHTATLPDSVTRHLPREDFAASPHHQHMLADLHSHITTQPLTRPHEREAAEFWHSHHAEIIRIVERTNTLGLLIRQRTPTVALCHADIHTGNLLIDSTHHLHIVDWDQPMLAPIERDLMFIADLNLPRMNIGTHTATPFFQGYGPTPLDPTILTYYRYERVMQDIAEFAHTIFTQPAVSDDTRADAFHWLTRQFAPNDMLEAAHHLYATLAS